MLGAAAGGKSRDQFFVFRDGTPVRADQFRSVLKQAIEDAGLDQDNYDTHSLRIGRTKDLFAAGYSIDQIKDAGGWRSNAVYNYLK